MFFLSSYSNALKAEWLKLKHSGTFWLCFGAAIFIPLLNTVVSFFIDVAANAQGNRWDAFIETNFQAFTGFFYPIFLVLVTARLVYMEHRSDTWKLMETQPLSKAALYLAKWKIAAAISLLCLCSLLFFALAGGLLLQLFKPEYKLQDYDISWGKTLAVLFRFWISSLAIISAQYFFGFLIKSFAWPMGIGLMATITGSIFTGFGVLSWWPYSATALTAKSYAGSLTGDFFLHHEKLALLWTLLFLWLGYRYFVRKNFVPAFFSPVKQALATCTAIVVFIFLLIWISKPHSLPAYGKTIIAGTIKTSKPLNNIVLLQAPAFDTVMVMPVVNGKFYAQKIEPLPAGIYYLRAGGFRTPIYFGQKDSLFIELTLNDKRNESKISGTRLAENAYLQRKGGEQFWDLTDYAYSFKGKEYAQKIMSKWKESSKEIERFKTIDNIKPAADFIQTQKKLLAYKLVQLADHYYPQVHAVYYPNEKLNYPTSLNAIRKEINFNDSSLISYAVFREYVTESLRLKSGRSDSIFFREAATSISNKVVREVVLFDAVLQNVFRIKDSVQRNKLLQQAFASIENQQLKNFLAHKNMQLRNMQRNKPAPNFAADAINNASFDLSKFSNRYVVIDVWATWCVPCKKEAPHFEQLAEQYTDEFIAFVSVSVDENKNAWRTQASGKKGKVLQLWAKNAEEDFSKSYAISSIPRFMLIGPKGNIINADLPPPSDPEFEAILQKEIPFLSNRSL